MEKSNFANKTNKNYKIQFKNKESNLWILFDFAGKC